MKLKFKRLSGRARALIRETPQSSAYDLFLAQEVELKPRSFQIVKMDVSLKIHKNHYGSIDRHPTWAQKISNIGGGIVDANYQGSVCVILLNISTKF